MYLMDTGDGDSILQSNGLSDLDFLANDPANEPVLNMATPFFVV